MPVDDMTGAPAVSSKDMPYVTFESKVVEDMRETRKQGRPVFRDQHYARITSPGTRDIHFEKLPGWWEKLDVDYRAGRVLPQWIDHWKRGYESFKQGQEIPLDGTPIRGWNMIPPSQQENLIRMNILTVEALANLTSDALSNVGMGALELKRRAEGWLAQSQDKAPLTIELAAIKGENDVLKATVANLTEKVAELAKQIEAKSKRGKTEE